MRENPVPTPDCPPLDRRRLVRALLLTPLLAGFYPALLLAEPIVMPISMVLSYASTILFGLPLVIYFYCKTLRQWWMYLIGGILCSIPTVVLYAVVNVPEHVPPFGLLPALGVMFWGASSGGIFWLVGVAGDSEVSLRTLFDPFETKR